MKKLAITLSAATLLLGGLVGCWDAPQGQGGLGADQRGFGVHQTDQRHGAGGFTGQRAGEGPITDMFTRDDRRGARGFGRDARQPATGLAGERGRGITGQHGGMTGQFGAAGRGGAAGAGIGGAGIGGAGFGGAAGRGAGFGGGAGIGGGAGLGAGDLGGVTGARRGDAGIGGGAGLGMGGTGAGFGAGAEGGAGIGRAGGGAGIGGGAGLGMRGAGTGFGAGAEGGAGIGRAGGGAGIGAGTGLGMGGTGRGAGFENRIPGVGGAGIVGDRAGYVDDRGILRGRGTTGRAGIGGLGQTGRTLQDRPGPGGFNITGPERANRRTRDREAPGTGMRDFNYPTDYDTQTVQRINTRLADVENVRDSRVVIHDNRILVGVEANGDDTQRVEQDVRRTVGDMAGDREVIVVTERDQFNQVRTVDDRLRGGEALDEVGATINEMFHDFGRAIQRPFERSR